MSVSTSLCSKSPDAEGTATAGWEGPATGTGIGDGVVVAGPPEDEGMGGVESSSASSCSAKSSSPGGGFSLFNSSLNCSK